MKNFFDTLYESPLFPVDQGSAEWIRARTEESTLENRVCGLIGEDERLHSTFCKYMLACSALEELAGQEQFARGVQVGANLILSVWEK